MTLQRQAPSDIGNETFTGDEGEGSVTFPRTEVLFGRNGTTLPSVDTQVSNGAHKVLISLIFQ